MANNITYEQIFDLKDDMVLVANKYCNCIETSKDIVQDVLIKIYEKGKGNYQWMAYKDQPNKHYLFTLTKNKAIDLLRKEKNKAKLDDNIEIVSDDEPDYYKEKMQKAHSAFCSLYGNIHWYDYQIAYMYYFDKLSLRKLSKKTGISVYSINNTINNVKEEFKNAFKENRTIYKETPTYQEAR